MKLLLINVNRKTEIRIPQGLLYLASAVHANGHEVIVHDEGLAPSPEKSLEQILSYQADIVGMSVYTIPWQLKRMEELSKAVKAACKSTWVMWGGWHAMLYHRHIISNENVDIVVRGPGEKVVCEILDALEQGRSLKSITGLVIKEDGQIVETGPECLDPEYLFPPLNFKLIDFDAYLKRHDCGEGILQYITTRGCHYRCRFCVMARLFRGRMFQKPRSQILGELRPILKGYAISSIHLSDDNAFRNEHEALYLRDLLGEATNGRPIPWRCCTRVDTLSRLSDDTYKKLIAGGCEGFVVGIESGVDRVLQLMRKGYSVAQIEKALKSLVDNGLVSNLFFFLFDFTGETETEAVQTLQLVRKVRLMLPQSDIMLNVYFPGVSDNSLAPPDGAEFSSRPMSEIADQYYADHIRNYHIEGIHIDILRYYFGASRQKEGETAGRDNFLHKIHRWLILLRIKYGIFALPFEYYLSNIIIKRIRKVLAWIKSNRDK